MTVLIAYGTIEGQTRKIAEFVAKQVRDTGENVVLFDTSDRIGDLEFEGVDKVILAASVHERRHPKAFEVFVDTNRKVLAEKPTLLLSVSLKAAFESGREDAQDYADEMKLRTGLNPDNELLVSGAIRSDSYDFYASQVLRYVVLDGQEFDPSIRDHEFTNWEELASSVAAFLKGNGTGQRGGSDGQSI